MDNSKSAQNNNQQKGAQPQNKQKQNLEREEKRPVKKFNQKQGNKNNKQNSNLGNKKQVSSNQQPNQKTKINQEKKTENNHNPFAESANNQKTQSNNGVGTAKSVPPAKKENVKNENPFASETTQVDKLNSQTQNPKPENEKKSEVIPKKEVVTNKIEGNLNNKNNQPKETLQTEKVVSPAKNENNNPFKSVVPADTAKEQSLKSDSKEAEKDDEKKENPVNKSEEKTVKSNPFEMPLKEEKQVTIRGEEPPDKEDLFEEPLNDDEDMLIDDGDSIWVIQRIIFSVLKTSAIIIIILVVVWLIWNPDENPIKNLVPNDSLKSTKKTVEVPKDKIEIPVKKSVSKLETVKLETVDNPIIVATALNLSLEKTRLADSDKIIEKSLAWCREGAAIFDLKMTEYFANKSRDQRLETYNNLLIRIDKLREKARILKRSLTLEIEAFSTKMETSDEEVDKYGGMFLNSVKNYDPVNVNNILSQKIKAEQDYFKYKNVVRARELVLQKIEKIDEYLVQFREIMIANQKAIVEDVQVVDFPSDPFNQILTPVEWRTFQENKSNNQK